MAAKPQVSTPTDRPVAGDDGLIRGMRPPQVRGFWLKHPNLIRLLSVAVVLVAWELYGRSLNPIFLSHPTAVAQAFWELLVSGDLMRATLQSLSGLGVGFGLAVVVGIAIGLLMGHSRVANYALDPFVTALYNTPSVALIPLIQLWFGLGFSAKVVIVFLSAVFPVIINSYAGVSTTSRQTVDVVRAYGATERQVTTKVVLPSAVPFVMAGMRLAVGRGVIGIVVAEFFTAISGLGGMIIIFSNAFATAKLFVPVITLVVIGLALTSLAKWLERRIAPWKETERASLGS
jgi:NitT/TauT family transport system permease protein